MTLKKLLQVEVGYRSIQLLPEYLIHEAALTQLLDALHKQHLVRSRHLARVQNLGQKDFGATKEVRHSKYMFYSCTFDCSLFSIRQTSSLLKIFLFSFCEGDQFVLSNI